MEEKIINKLRKDKRKLESIYKYVKQYTDVEALTLVDSETLNILTIISQINEDLSDVIYLLLENKNS